MVVCNCLYNHLFWFKNPDVAGLKLSAITSLFLFLSLISNAQLNILCLGWFLFGLSDSFQYVWKIHYLMWKIKHDHIVWKKSGRDSFSNNRNVYYCLWYWVFRNIWVDIQTISWWVMIISKTFNDVNLDKATYTARGAKHYDIMIAFVNVSPCFYALYAQASW